MMEEESAEPAPVAFRATSDDMNEWKDLDSTLGVPKPWSMVDVPDLFLTNLIHDVDHTFADDSLTEFSSTMNHSGSDSESSSDAFKDFMMRQSSPESLSNTPPLVHSCGDGGVDGTTTSPPDFPLDTQDMAPLTNQQLASIFGFPPTSSCNQEPVQGISPSSVQQSPPVSMHKPEIPVQTTSPVSESQASSGSPTQESILASLHMQPGSNSNAMTALNRLRAVTHECEQKKQENKQRQVKSSLSSATTPQSSSSSNVPSDGSEMWTRKNAHNAIERRYRSNINDRIAGLRDVVPALREMQSRGPRRKRRRGKAEEVELVDGIRAATKLSKATILSKATEYICYLKSREVRLSREVAGLHMLLRSLEGGDELMSQWNAEMERLHAMYPPMDAVYPDGPAPPLSPSEDAEEGDLVDESDDADDSESVSSGGEPMRTKAARYMLGAFLIPSLLGRSDWGTEAPDATPQAHVMGVCHQLWKRSLGSSDTVHPYNHVPLSDLVWELLRGCALLGLIVVVLMSVGAHIRRWCRRLELKQSSRLQHVAGAEALLRAPVEQAQAAEPMQPAHAKRMYAQLSELLHVPRTYMALSWRIAWTCLCLITTLFPGVTAWIRYASADPTVSLLYRRAHMRRAELELTLGGDIQPSLGQRLYTLVVLQFAACIYRATVDESLLLALMYCDLAQRTRIPLLMRHGAYLWRKTGARLVDAPNSDETSQRMLAELLSVPVPQALAYARSNATEASVIVSPLANMLEALRQEALLSYWTTIITSMMRTASSAEKRWSPHVLDVIQDSASLRGIQQQLHALSRDGASSAALHEQMLVAQGMLELAAGQLTRAQMHARSLKQHQPSSLAAQQFLALWKDTPLVASAPRGPVDMLASVVIGWFVLLRKYHLHGGTHEVSDQVAACTSTLQELASQCLWTFVSPPEKGGHVYLQSEQAPCLVHALDLLMDQLSP